MAARTPTRPLADRVRSTLPRLAIFAVPVLALIGASSSCYTQGETTCGQESAPLAPLRGRLTGDVLVTDDAGVPILDDAGFVIPALELAEDGTPRTNPQGDPIIKRGPQAGSTVIVELCALYSENPDPSKAHPNYRYATVTREDGTFEVMVPQGKVGIHTFKNGWFYGRVEVDDAPDRFIETPFFVEAAARSSKAPTLSSFKVSPAEAAPGQTLSFSVDTRRAGTDPMSEEVVVYEPTTSVARAFTPPGRGAPQREVGGKAGWPDGTWTATMPAPSRPGTYTFYAHSTSEHCVSSNKLGISVLVR